MRNSMNIELIGGMSAHLLRCTIDRKPRDRLEEAEDTPVMYLSQGRGGLDQFVAEHLVLRSKD